MNTNVNYTLVLAFYLICSITRSQDQFTALNNNHNWTSLETYDFNGTVKSRSVTYFDLLGNDVLSQARDFKSDKIWMSQTMYDNQGRPALTTLSAPSGISFGFKSNFIKKPDGSNYSISDFESDADNPSPIGRQTSTLGWYYSDNNNIEKFQDITDYPFARTIYSKLNPGTPLRQIGGNKVNDEWLQGYNFTMVASQELSQDVAFGKAEYSRMKIQKSITRDVHGIENVQFTDIDGRVLASARSGGAIKRKMSLVVGKQGYVDIHVPVGSQMGFAIEANNIEYEVYNLITEELISPSINLENGFYRVAYKNVEDYNGSGSIVVNYHENYYDYSLNQYDLANRLISSKQPLNKLETTYEYNSLGQLIRTESPDEGWAIFKYRRDGQIRFSQSEKQYNTDLSFSYTDYDNLGRPITSGVFYPNQQRVSNPLNIIEQLDPDEPGLSGGFFSETTVTLYDKIDSEGIAEAFGNDTRKNNYVRQSFVSGNVSKTWNQSPLNNVTWYSYDIYGRVIWIVQNIHGLGVKTIDYEYNPINGQVDKVLYQKGASDQFIHRYIYDPVDYSLTKVETSTNNTDFTEQAEYTYYETGGLKRLNLADGLQGIDYVYNLNGALKSINHPNLNANSDPGGDTNDLFGMNLHYYQGDYLRVTTPTPIVSTNKGIDQYNGNIKAIDWNTNRPGLTNTPQSYFYKYNRNNWLEGASLNNDIIAANLMALEIRDRTITKTETVEASEKISLRPGFKIKAGSSLRFRAEINQSDGGIDTSGDYNVYGITYDANGNIQTLNRNKNTTNNNNAMDQLSYVYKQDKPNQLLRVDDAAGTVSDADDIEDQDGDNYAYDEIGQLVENKEEGIEYSYNTTGLVTQIKKDGENLVTFKYNERGHRVRKDRNIISGSEVTYYVRDVAGQTLAVYRQTITKSGGSPQLVENTIYGAGRLGVRKANGTSLYQLTDHLGNVRAVVGRNGSGQAMALTSATDYYPFGMPMPGRNLKGDYRYAYQGQEKDPETGKEAFELRLWDSRIGRWLSTDPYGQYNSPYLGMGNNPIMMIDQDGGMAGPCDEPGCQQVLVNSLISDGAKLLSVDYASSYNQFSIDLFNYPDDQFIELQEVLIFDSVLAEAQYLEQERNPVLNFFFDLAGVNSAVRNQANALDEYNKNGLTSYLFTQANTNVNDEKIRGPEFTDVASSFLKGKFKNGRNKYRSKGANSSIQKKLDVKVSSKPTVKKVKLKTREVLVKGHYRTSKLGKQFWVNEHSRTLNTLLP